MTNKEMREIIMDHIIDFADKEKQYEAWFVQKTMISNPGEDYVMLFDDRHIEEFVNAPNNYLTKKENEELEKFIDILNSYADKHKDEQGYLDFDAEEVFYDPEWEVIRQEAQKLYDLLEKAEGVEELEIVDDWKYPSEIENKK